MDDEEVQAKQAGQAFQNNFRGVEPIVALTPVNHQLETGDRNGQKDKTAQVQAVATFWFIAGNHGNDP